MNSVLVSGFSWSDASSDGIQVVFVGFEGAAHPGHFNAANQAGHCLFVKQDWTFCGKPGDQFREF
jgi:hypothetical protein